MTNYLMTTWRVLLTALLVLAAQPVSAQQYVLSNTTLNGAITATQTTLILAAATASSGSTVGAPAAGQCLQIDGEQLRIVSMSSTTATVTRDVSGAGPHATSAVVWTGPCGGFFLNDPPNLAGNQTCSLQPRPWVNAVNGNVWFCSTVNNKWTGTNFVPFAYNSTPVAQ